VVLEVEVEVELVVEVEFDLECGALGKGRFTSSVEKLAETALGTAGQRVSSVSSVIGWNFA
jgi:hypothetical protein